MNTILDIISSVLIILAYLGFLIIDKFFIKKIKKRIEEEKLKFEKFINSDDSLQNIFGHIFYKIYDLEIDIVTAYSLIFCLMVIVLNDHIAPTINFLGFIFPATKNFIISLSEGWQIAIFSTVGSIIVGIILCLFAFWLNKKSLGTKK